MVDKAGKDTQILPAFLVQLKYFILTICLHIRKVYIYLLYIIKKHRTWKHYNN